MFKIVHMPTLLQVKDNTDSIYRYKLNAIIEYEDDVDKHNVYGTIFFRTKKDAKLYIKRKDTYQIVDWLEECPAIELYNSDEESYAGSALPNHKKKEFMIVEVEDV